MSEQTPHHHVMLMIANLLAAGGFFMASVPAIIFHLIPAPDLWVCGGIACLCWFVAWCLLAVGNVGIACEIEEIEKAEGITQEGGDEPAKH